MLHYKTYQLQPEDDWVVFIHGAGGSSSIWFRQLKEFCQHFNVLMLDLRGHGGSKDFFEKYVKDDYTFEDVSRDVFEVMDFLKIKKAHFIGISLGCIIIRTMGEMAPARLKSMILGGAIIRLNIRSNFLMQFGNLFKKIVPFMWLYGLFAWVIMPKKRHQKSRSLFIQEARRLAHKEFIRWYQLTAEVNPLLKYFREKETDIPTLYVMGEEDYMFLPPVKRITARHKSAELEILENSGHVVNVDQPEKFNEVVIRFIKNHF